MKRYHGGKTVDRGVYLNVAGWEFVQAYDANPVLPGGAEVTYFKVPAAFTLLGGPVAGLVFIIFLPFIGIVAILGFLGYKAGRAAKGLLHKGPRPPLRTQKEIEPAPEMDAQLDRLMEEIATRRRGGKQLRGGREQ